MIEHRSKLASETASRRNRAARASSSLGKLPGSILEPFQFWVSFWAPQIINGPEEGSQSELEFRTGFQGALRGGLRPARTGPLPGWEG